MKTIIKDGIKYEKIVFVLTDEQNAKEFDIPIEEVKSTTKEAMMLTPDVIEIDGDYYKELY